MMQIKRLVSRLSFVLLCSSAWPLLAQQVGGQGGTLLSERASIRIEATAERVNALEARIDRIEATRPEAMEERIAAMQQTLTYQQVLLWGIFCSLVVNFLTGNRIFSGAWAKSKPSNGPPL